MAIRDELKGLLQVGDVVNNVNFSINGFRVDRALLQTVYDAVDAFRVYVLVNQNVQNHSAQRDGLSGRELSLGADAQYDSNSNAFTFQRNTLADDHAKALALHEAVHAAFDINSISMWAIDDEAAAYIAQFIYLRARGTAATVNTPTFNAAVAAASAIMTGGGLTSVLLQNLQNALRANPLYRDIAAPDSRYPRNGLR